MIDTDGFRTNVGIILANPQGQVLWARRIQQDAWQFPQGGIKTGEAPDDAMLRELNEEIGLTTSDIKIIACTRGWLRYRLPKKLIRHDRHPVCIGQKQKWYLLQFMNTDNHVCLNTTDLPEFDNWQWVSYWYPAGQVVSFKRDVYRRALRELSPYISQLQQAYG
ncbi:RNA pyrophosphohydrolase [invertebrate metagenome]|uniref:RNA pyrophosphohydrolase n=1 Tax=invertebrate metagenome TaxID=1711999 RepID=A0A2H9T966_9ZZZZ